jgi:3',5'-cyclic AMP phosphodiesterase CpdA
MRRILGSVICGALAAYMLGVGSAAAAEKADTLIVTARLAEIPGKFAPNDLYNYVYIMKYQVIKVEKGTYKAKEILVGEYNPLIPRAKIADKMAPFVKGNADKFAVGAKQRLVLITPISAVWNDATDDEYFDSDLGKYFALRTDIAK